MPPRGSYLFEIGDDGHVRDNEGNLEKLRAVLLDKEIVNNSLGPGDNGDFDFGAWHVFCHLVAGCAVFRRPDGVVVWVEISHVPSADLYAATATAETTGASVATVSLGSDQAKALLRGAKLLGFVEGSSLGHISARGIIDPPDRFNKWMRQDFDQSELSSKDGGRVWEHWCTVRDIRATSTIGSSVLRSYLTLVSLCGGSFVALIARGRVDYDHPRQLHALVKSGFIAKEEALTDTRPTPIPHRQELLLYRSSPGDSLSAARDLEWSESGLSYFMFSRRINRWNPLENVRSDLSSI